MIALSQVSKIFSHHHQPILAVDNVSLRVEKGQIYGIIGYSGAGKSTLIRLLNGLEKPTSGTVYVAGQDITQARGEALRQARLKISMIFQHFNLLWSRTVSENIAFSMQIAGTPKAAIRQRVAELIALVGLQGKEDSYPSRLSGGQKQRVGIARALANAPAVLLCDEATSALDPQTTDAILDLLLDINHRLNLTIVLITHEMQVVRKICRRVAVMDSGRIVEHGEVLDVFTRPQQPITRQFVKQSSHFGPPSAGVSPQLLQSLPGVTLKLTFLGLSVQQPVVTELALRYNLPLSILHGTITQTANGIFGELWLHGPISAEQIAPILADLRQQQVVAEVVAHV